MRFILTIADTSVFVNYAKIIIKDIYIDKVTYAIKKSQLFDKFETQLKEEFEVKLLGKARLILRMLVKKDIKCKTFHLSHIYYI